MAATKQIFLIVFPLAISVLVGVADGYIGYDYQAGRENCKDEQGGIHEIGDAWYPENKCSKSECEKGKGGVIISSYWCSRVNLPHKCKLVTGTGTYPHCCPDIACPNTDSE